MYVGGSNKHRDFEDHLLPRDRWEGMLSSGDVLVAVNPDLDEYLAERDTLSPPRTSRPWARSRGTGAVGEEPLMMLRLTGCRSSRSGGGVQVYERVTGRRRRWYTSALMLRRAPERTVDERRNALEEANRVRFARAATKRNLKSGDLDIYDLLMDPSEELRGAKVEEMLLAVKGMGRIKVTRVLREAGISRSKTLVGLTHGQRDRLLGALGCEDA